VSAGYQVLPLIYDRWQKSYPADYTTLILPRLLSTLERHPAAAKSMVDVACGTGTLALNMARDGWRVHGVDASALMLAEAEKKCRRKKGIAFHQLDMRTFRIPERVGLATSFFDSLNHLADDRDLLRTFRSVARALLPGGLFVFDLNTEHCYQTLWTKTGAVHHRDFTLLLENRYSGPQRTAHSFVTLFLREGERYVRMGEIVRERCFRDSTVRAALKRAGLELLETENFNFTGIPEVGEVKSWWVAAKRR
jgi:SAM-dependent methyltransferase